MESKNTLQTLINLKQIVEVSQGRGCWKAEEMKDIGITYNNVSEIVKQLQAEQSQAEQSQAEQSQAGQSQAGQSHKFSRSETIEEVVENNKNKDKNTTEENN